MAIGYFGYESSADEVRPFVCIAFCTGQTKARFTGKGDFSGFTARTAPVPDISHFIWVTAIDHFLDNAVIIVGLIAWIDYFELAPMIFKDLFECIFVNTFHGSCR
jgi:hypothetical protein